MVFMGKPSQVVLSFPDKFEHLHRPKSKKFFIGYAKPGPDYQLWSGLLMLLIVGQGIVANDGVGNDCSIGKYGQADRWVCRAAVDRGRWSRSGRRGWDLMMTVRVGFCGGGMQIVDSQHLLLLLLLLRLLLILLLLLLLLGFVDPEKEEIPHYALCNIIKMRYNGMGITYSFRHNKRARDVIIL